MSQFAAKMTQGLSRLQDKIPEQKVGLVAADAFFCRKVDLPDGLSQVERNAFIQLNLEGNSPFPMEQLAWGFLEKPGFPYAFVYATPKARLRKLEIEKAESYYQLFPGFISMFGETVSSPTVRFLCQNGVLSALYMGAQNPVPERVLSRRVTADMLTDDALLDLREDFLKSLQLDGFTPEDGLWLGTGLRIQPDGAVRFEHRHVSGRKSMGMKACTLGLDDNTLWEADLRDDLFAGKEKTVRRRSSVIWLSLRAGIWFALILALLQLGNFAVAGFNAWRERQIEVIEPQATRVDNKLTLAARLNQSTEEDLKPFVLLEFLNPMRPDSVYFDKVRSSAFNELQMEGNSTEGVTPVNAFADAIRKQDFVAKVDYTTQTRNNQTSFEMVVTFARQPPEPEGGFIIPSEEEEETAETEEGGEG